MFYSLLQRSPVTLPREFSPPISRRPVQQVVDFLDSYCDNPVTVPAVERSTLIRSAD